MLFLCETWRRKRTRLRYEGEAFILIKLGNIILYIFIYIIKIEFVI